MRRFLVTSLLVASCGVARAQTAGVSTEWDTRKMLDALTLQMQHFQAVVERVKPDSWTANGAPATYATQWKTAQTEIQYLLASISAIQKQPEALPSALDAYFRMLAMESTVGSVIEGIRRYQNPALADLLQSVMNENGTNRDKLRQFIQDLAVEKEQELKVADREAQRCRADLLRQSGSPPREKHK